MPTVPGEAIDANVLVQSPLRDTSLRLAEGPALYRPLWSRAIMAEVRRTLLGQFKIAPDRVAHLESKLQEHFRESWVEGFEPLIPMMSNDTKDRHVLAVAVHAKARWLVTFNLRQFPPATTTPWRVTAIGPSSFLKRLYTSDPDSVIEVLRQQAEDIWRPFVAHLRVLHKSVPSFIEDVCRGTHTDI